MKPYSLSAKCYKWGTCCPLDFDTTVEAKSAVVRPQDASEWVISEFEWVPGLGPRFVRVVARLCGSIGATWREENLTVSELAREDGGRL